MADQQNGEVGHDYTVGIGTISPLGLKGFCCKAPESHTGPLAQQEYA